MFMRIAKNKEFWYKVRTEEDYKPLLDDLMKLYESVGKQENIPSLRYSEYKIYFESGSRIEYENSYFFRRRRLNCLAILSLLYPENKEYFQKLQDTIWAICDECSWVLPAHAGSDTQMDYSVIDLFSSETGFALSEIKYLLGERMDSLVANRIDEKVNARIIEPFLSRSFGWESAIHNWAAVCATGVAAAFLYQRPDLFSSISERISKIMESFLSSYKEDGICREGMGYWEYGFGFFIWHADLIQEFTHEKINYFKQDKIQKIAEFPQKVYLNDNVTVSFADGDQRAEILIGLTHYLKSVYPKTVSAIPFKNIKREDYCGRWCHAIRNFVFFNSDYLNSTFENTAEYYMEPSAWYVKKTPLYSFAAKAGDNDEPHNHNDIGSFILTNSEKQIFVDLGAGAYTKQYFGDERYSILCNSSEGHNVPMINGKGQQTGADYQGTMQLNDHILCIDMKNAYAEQNLKKLQRKFIFHDKGIQLTDSLEFDGEGSYTERLVTLEKPLIREGCITVENVSVSFDSSKWKVQVSSATHACHNTNKVIPVYLIDFISENEKCFCADFEVR